MTLLQIDVTRFGALEGRSLTFSPSISIVLGANEAGKTSLQRAIRTALFGFDPAAATRHPYATGADALEVGASVRSGDRVVRVERRLEKTPWKRSWTATGASAPPEFSRGNEPVDGLAGVTPGLFDSVFVVGADELRAAGSDPGPELDRLLLGDGVGGPSARALRTAIDAERASIWRRDQRSKKTRVHAVDAELARLSEEGRAARAVERGLIALEVEITERAARAASAEAEAVRIEDEIARLELVERIARNVRAMGSPEGVVLDAIGGALPPAPGPILAELDDAEEALREPAERLGRPPAPFDDQDRALLAREGELESVIRAESERERLVERLEEAIDREAQAVAAGGSGQSVVALAGAIGVAAALASFVLDLPALAAACCAVLPVGFVALERRRRADLGHEPSLQRAREAAEKALDDLGDGWLRLCEGLGLEVGAVDAVPGMLRARLERARARRVAWTHDEAERQRAASEEARARRRVDEVTARFDALTEALRAAVPGERSVERAHARVEEAFRARERCIGALREIELDPRMDGLEGDPRLRRARSEGAFDPSEARRLEVALAAARAEAAGAHEAKLRAEERIAIERPPRTTSEIDSEIASLRAERAAALEEHDRLALLSALLAEGERRHRAAHQSAILARASAMVEALTDGRARAIECVDDGRQLVLVGSEGRQPVALPLSRGLREQVHLCLRLAAVEHIDPGGEGPPMLLDEALAHWDERRRAGFYGALGALEGRRQVLLFTCHAPLAHEAHEALGAPIIRL